MMTRVPPFLLRVQVIHISRREPTQPVSVTPLMVQDTVLNMIFSSLEKIQVFIQNMQITPVAQPMLRQDPFL